MDRGSMLFSSTGVVRTAEPTFVWTVTAAPGAPPLTEREYPGTALPSPGDRGARAGFDRLARCCANESRR